MPIQPIRHRVGETCKECGAEWFYEPHVLTREVDADGEWTGAVHYTAKRVINHLSDCQTDWDSDNGETVMRIHRREARWQ